MSNPSNLTVLLTPPHPVAIDALQFFYRLDHLTDFSNQSIMT